MRTHSAGEVARLIIGRATVLELLLGAVIIALAVSFLASSLPTLAGASAAQTALAGALILLLSLAYVALKAISPLDRERTVAAWFLYSPKANSVLDVRRYGYGWHLASYLRDAFSENRALKAPWEREPLSRQFDPDRDFINAARGAKQLIIEATEYFVLTTLSTHLVDYFNRQGLDPTTLVTLEREHVPDVLLKNRFLELFSKPMEDRPAFLGYDEREGGEIVASSGARGARFEHFDLVLPRGSRVRRTSPTEVAIETNRLTLALNIDFKGFNTALPHRFEELYLGLSPLETHAFQVLISVRVSFPILALLRPRGWQYYQWVDSFLESLDDACGENAFFSRIGWETALTTIEALRASAAGGKGASS